MTSVSGPSLMTIAREGTNAIIASGIAAWTGIDIAFIDIDFTIIATVTIYTSTIVSIDAIKTGCPILAWACSAFINV